MLTIARCLLIGTLALSVAAVADDSKRQPERKILERHDQSAVAGRANDSGKEIVIGTATLPAGTTIGFHTHPGDEIGYIIQGSVIWKVRGQPDKTLKAGDSFFNPSGSVHSVASADSGDSVVISTWIVEKGKPMATPVP